MSLEYIDYKLITDHHSGAFRVHPSCRSSLNVAIMEMWPESWFDNLITMLSIRHTKCGVLKREYLPMLQFYSNYPLLSQMTWNAHEHTSATKIEQDTEKKTP